MESYKQEFIEFMVDCLGDEYLRSLLYHPDFTTEYRKGKA